MPACLAAFLAPTLQSWQDYRTLDLLTSWQDQLYAAVCFSAINSVEKVSLCLLVLPTCTQQSYRATTV